MRNIVANPCFYKGPENYPDITICPFPSFNNDELRKSGYYNSFEYSRGQMWPTVGRVGWSGNTTAMDVIERVSTLKTEADCPIAWLKLINGAHQSNKYAKFKLTSMVHPIGKCCKVLPPEEGINSTLGGIGIRVHLQNSVKFVEGFKLFLSNREESNDFHIKSFNMQHDQLKTLKSELGYVLYDLEVHENLYLENNGNYQCQYYKPGDYNFCLNKEYLKQQLSILNCTPPWLTSRQDLWCQNLMKLNKSVADMSSHGMDIMMSK